ncbi:putative ABC transporter permease subunit, partial [Fannyhessea vaginae]
ITAIYPLSKVFMKNSFFSLSVGMGFFIVISMIVYYLFVKNVSLRYDLLISLSKTTPRYSSHKKINKRSSPFIALYKKELGRYLNSYMVVLNTGLGIVLLIIFSLVLLVSSPQQISEYVKIQNINEVFSNYAPVYIASMLILSCPAASSISLEGKNAWIMQSSPISMDMILKSKLAVNFTLHALGYIVSIFVFTIKVNMDMIQYIRLLIIPICYSIFITVLGIALNKKYPNYGWNNEMIVVKQSVPVILSGVIGMIALATPVMIIWFFHVPIGITLWVTAFILLVSAIIIYSKASKSKYI